MKRKILSLLLAFSVLLSLCGCAFSDDGVKVKVTFVCEDASQSVLVPLGGVASPPKTPRVEGKLFCGWYTDRECESEYDFSTRVLTETVLYAGFVLDGAALTNEITQSVMSALVTVSNFYPLPNGREWEAQGSGFIYKIEGGRAYVLTNCHVAYAPSYTQTIRITDFRGEEYEAAVYRKSLFSEPAISAEYDLAILSFPYTGSTLSVIPFADENATIGEEVISLGSPNNQSHAITFGEVLGYRAADLPDSAKEESNVTFEIVYHTAAISNGSSGGPLLDGDLALIGVNYAGLPAEEGEVFGHGCAVPLDKVLEFLSLYE
jgi:S1-C subfamily serine protease